jgi:uncharacterized protein YraI
VPEILAVCYNGEGELMTMRKTSVLCGALLAVISFALVAAVSSARAQVTTDITGKALFDINIRSAPGTNRAVIDALPYAQEVTAIGRNDANNWVQITYNQTTGWVANWLLIFDDDTYKLPVTTDVDAPPASGPGPFDLNVPFNVNMRSAASDNSTILAVIPFDTVVQAIGRDGTSTWIEIKYGGKTGWLVKRLVVMRGDINVLPVVTSRAPAAPAVAPVVTVAPASVPVGGITVVTPYQVNLHQTPATDSPVVATVPFDQTLVAIGRNAGNNWIEVKTGSTTGWLAKWIVAMTDDPSQLPVTSASTAFTKTYDTTITAKTTVDLVMRSQPGPIYASVGQIPAGTEFQPESRLDDSTWLKVNFNGTEGWIISWPLTASADLNNLPTENPFP